MEFRVVSVFLLLCLSGRVIAHNELVAGVCKESLDNAKCSKILGFDPRTGSAKELKDLAKIALDLAISNGNLGLNLIHQMSADQSHRGPDERKALKECESWYKAVVASYNSALKELASDAMTASYDSANAGDDADTCGRVLSSAKILNPLVSERNSQVKLYSNIAFVVTYRLSVQGRV